MHIGVAHNLQGIVQYPNLICSIELGVAGSVDQSSLSITDLMKKLSWRMSAY